MTDTLIDLLFHGGPAHGETYPIPANGCITRVDVAVPGLSGYARASYVVERIRGKPCHLAYVGRNEGTVNG